MQNGIYADALLSRWKKCKSYVMIDTWLKQTFYDDYANVPNAEQNRIYL